jgi:4-aminobutyrate aminotransferase-like enzyme
MLTQDGYYGPEGKIAKLSNHFKSGIEKLKAGSCKGLIGEVRVIGGMIGFGVLGQTLDDTKKFLMQLFENGVVAFYAGHDPYVVRCLPPFGVMTEKEIDTGLAVIEKTLLSLAKK